VVKGFLELRGVPCVLQSDGLSIYPSAAIGRGVTVLVPEHGLLVARMLVGGRTPPRRPRGGRVVRLSQRSGS
jgi:hypothetical protein